MALQIGDKIPETLGTDQNGEPIKAEQFRGKKLALYFYPKDNTPGCTAQACSLRDGYNDLRKAGYEIVGVSVDSEKSHQRFIDKFSLPFPLIADTGKRLVEVFGVWQQKSMMGKKFMGTVRTTFLVDENGIIRDKIEGRGVDTKNHAMQILEKTKAGSEQ
ncbi:thioredoxin-dependent thiol peroxidase [Proteiniphilum saccharofermentans]|uniref:thioredoxin-dependent thiol peroxidase n=1 Tax=Proteiniphilum saccharofermentans TaxID=1642647 RepID=UPI0028AA4C73|nr:thioredoxin-dependent thiol peroxidase [Proteiniphilum saccharofermentans]